MVLTEKLRRPKALAAAALLIVASVMPVLSRDRVDAYGLLAARKITMSSSASGTVTTGQNPGTDVTYEVDFDIASTQTIQGMVIDFCVNSPIIGETCTAPTGFDINKNTLAYTASAGMTGFSVSTAASDANTLVLTSAGWSATAGNSATFALGTTATAGDGITNPTDTDNVTAGNQVGTYYARILTYTTSAGATGYTPTSPGAEPPLVDAGGVALSTAQQIDVTAKVQEKLDFCVYTTAINGQNDCAGAGYTALTLGDTNGVLTTSGPFVNKEAKYSVATNASQGVIIRMKGTTLTSGSFSISATGEGTQSGAQSSPGSEQFGICTYRNSGDTNLVPDTVYDGDNAGNTSTACSGTTDTAGTATTGGDNSAYFAFDDSGTGTTSTYGETIAAKAAGTFSAGVIAMLGNIAYTTEAGIYTTRLTFIATGTY